jgi:hypothetical protein
VIGVARLGNGNELALIIGGDRGGIAAFEEAVNGSDVVEVRLVARIPNGELQELRFGRFPYASSHRRTLERVFDQCELWIAQELKSPARATRSIDQPPEKKLRLFDRARFVLSEARRWTWHAVRYFFEEVRWDVGVAKNSIERFIADPKSAWMHWCANDDREFLADPFFVCDEQEKLRLLCETQRDQHTTGIVAIDLNEPQGARIPVLSSDISLSYPYVFEVQGEPWMLPEQHESKQLEAYHLNGKATPVARWTLDGVTAPVDPTIVEYDGRWWLFCTDHERGPNYALHLFWATSPHGPWHAHLRNPVKIDITGARPAGNFFTRDGVLYRPAQDGSVRYGRAITIQRIDVLTPEEFEETQIASVEASSLGREGAVGVHTLSHGHGWIAVDAQFTRWSLTKGLQQLRRLFA